jgi:hypothetical protein
MSSQAKQRQAAVKQRWAPGDAAADTPSWISLVVAVTFAVQALLIGTILSAGPLLVADAMGFGVWQIGLTFAGEQMSQSRCSIVRFPSCACAHLLTRWQAASS